MPCLKIIGGEVLVRIYSPDFFFWSLYLLWTFEIHYIYLTVTSGRTSVLVVKIHTRLRH
jgi:hypothetical protein